MQTNDYYIVVPEIAFKSLNTTEVLILSKIHNMLKWFENVYISNKAIGKIFNISERSTIRAINKLANDGYINVVKHNNNRRYLSITSKGEKLFNTPKPKPIREKIRNPLDDIY